MGCCSGFFTVSANSLQSQRRKSNADNGNNRRNRAEEGQAFSQREMTVIGAKGVYLSGGEVQRIAIARAILKNANIIIMDEASAAADPENEYELQQAFQKLMRGKTVIMIAHRLSSIQNVDQILFVQNGKVVEQGTHNELMAYNGRYKDFQDVYCKANQWRLA